MMLGGNERHGEAWSWTWTFTCALASSSPFPWQFPEHVAELVESAVFKT